ncbi:DUF192 domain-containing protein [Chroococcidiopsis sp. FACHB-1243]|uniref:DUF192 domain-containing protein n=1 Tax=Chroococcidiopsis sp. [FACHB-1243] TaxID=2692781 RepID=UPI0017874883|nr:DUF192 domain-containing protein [Chroococcidiopsis sp. [FACHB-1243]]MBD2307867.1 DUF192 domain-containing protein [Chroococcidiopsis sp. [FACHB-1243]]
MFSKIPLWLLSISIFIILTTLYLGFSWLSLQLSSPQKPQVLPVLARIEVAKQIIYLEVPQTPEQEAQGLMYRTIIPRNRGILFEVNPPQAIEFSMQNILVPVDTIFLRNTEIQQIQIAVPTCNEVNCPTYSSKVKVDQMVQLQARRTVELGLKAGDRLPIEFLDLDTKTFR